MPLSSFFFWFGFAFAKEELLPSLSQSSPTHIMYSLHLKVQTSLSFSPTYSHIASLSSLEAFPWLWNPSSYRISFLIWFLPPRHHSDGTALMAAFQWLKPPGLAWSPGPCLILLPQALNKWSCPAPPNVPWLWWHCRISDYFPGSSMPPSSHRWSPGPQVLNGHGFSLHIHSHRSLTYFTASTITFMSES